MRKIWHCTAHDQTKWHFSEVIKSFLCERPNIKRVSNDEPSNDERAFFEPTDALADAQPKKSRSSSLSGDDEPSATCAVFSGVAAAGVAVSYCFLRAGMGGNSLGEISEALFFSFFLLFTPPAYGILVRKYYGFRSASWIYTNAGILLLAMISAVLAGFLDLGIGHYLFFSFCTVGLVGTVVTVSFWISKASAYKNLLFAFFCSFFACWCVGSAFGGNYHNPLFVESLSIGRAHLDELVVIASTNMIKTYGVPTTGLDGIPLIHYHFGSWWIFAQLSRLMGISTHKFLNLVVPVVFLPLLLNTMLLFITAIERFMRESRSTDLLRSDWIFWGLFTAGVIGFLPLIDSRFCITSIGVASESYAVSLILMFVMLCIEVSLCPTAESLKEPSLCESAIVLLVVLPAMHGFLIATKVSTGFLIGCINTYLFVRLRLYRRPVFVLSGVLTLLVMGITMACVIEPTNLSGGRLLGFAPFHLVTTFVPSEYRTFFYIGHFFWSWFFVVVFFVVNRIRTWAHIKEAFLGKKSLSLEIVLVALIVGVAPGLALAIGDGNAIWFSVIPGVLSVALLAANASAIGSWLLGSNGDLATRSDRNHTRRRFLRHIGIFLVILVATGTTFKVMHGFAYAVYRNISIRLCLCTGKHVASNDEIGCGGKEWFVALARSMVGTASGGNVLSIGRTFTEMLKPIWLGAQRGFVESKKLPGHPSPVET